MAQGRKTGGRQKGTPNRASAARQQEIVASGLTPLDFMLAVLRDEAKPFEARFEAARAAAPYVHPRLTATHLSGTLNSNPLAELTDAELVAFITEARELIANDDNADASRH